MSGVQFANLEWVYLIWGILIVVVVVVYLEFRNRRVLGKFIAAAMQERLARTNSIGSRLLGWVLWGVSLTCFAVALLRPQSGFTERQVPVIGAQIMVCLDVSRSMLAEDAVPNRLERAKSELEILLNYLQRDQVGLIAFAGKSTLLCPLTNDFGYLKILLRSTSPSSVGRGGTLLETPIRRAMAGFSDTADMSKVIILITDGEDNGSKPLDAAKEAAERGITIITIGFGDQAGAKIQITDPQTGLSNYVTDSSGSPIISRLDVPTLTQIATLTDGAFIPAGVGSLDFESIHRDHIQPLLRAGSETRQIVRNEAFRWPLVVGLGLFVVSLLISNPILFSRKSFGQWLDEKRIPKSSSSGLRFSSGSSPEENGRVGLSWAVPLTWILIGFLSSDLGQCQEGKNNAGPVIVNPSTSTPPTKPGDEVLGADMSSSQPEWEIPADPIQCYNQSLVLLDSNSQYAEKLLEAARTNAGKDAELRYRAAYNLGWVKTYQADAALESQPEDALQSLKLAANWFREAIRLRPRNEDARKNLEIILRRITELADSLREVNPKEFEGQLAELIQRQSQILQRSRQLLEQVSRVELANGSLEQFDKPFRLLSVDQRLLNSDLHELNLNAMQEVDQGEKQTAASSPTPGTNLNSSPQLRLAQMRRAVDHIERAGQRLGQARSQFRLRNGARGARRSALGLDELQRARDQLRQPADVIGQVLADSRLLNQQTNALMAGENLLSAFLGRQKNVPKWLDVEYLEQFQNTQYERTEDLYEVIQSAAGSSNNGEPDSAIGVPQENLQEASDYLKQAIVAFQKSAASLKRDPDDPSIPSGKILIEVNNHQLSAIDNLLEAYERFADFKSLIEVAYQTQSKQDRDFSSARNLPLSLQSEIADALGKIQIQNLGRVRRILRLVDSQLAEIQAVASQPETDPGSANADQDSLESAKQLLPQIEADINKIMKGLEKYSRALSGTERDTEKQNVDWTIEEKLSNSATRKLEELRRLFFTVVEQLRETVQRQDILNKDTEKVVRDLSEKSNTPLDEEDNSRIELKSGPLMSRQAELSANSGEISKTLREQADQLLKQATVSGPEQATSPADAGSRQPVQRIEKIQNAAKLVAEAELLINDVLQSGTPAAWNPDQIKTGQSEALEKLILALQQLDESNNEPGDQQENQDQESEEEQGGSSRQDESTDENSSMNQILQGIRDREAKRRESKERMRSRERVEKDW